MHVVIINGSPRTQKYSNTAKILQSFIKGLEKESVTCELYSLSNHGEWDSAREAYLANENIIFALPMYVDSIPSLMLEFLETLKPHASEIPTSGAEGSLRERGLSFILHGGFGEGYQFRFCEKLLKSITVQLGCNYGGCLIKGGSFMFRLFESDRVERMTKPYTKMGISYARNGNFITPETKKFTGPERYPWLVRQLAGLFLKLVVNKKFKQFAVDWGCFEPLDHKPYK